MRLRFKRAIGVDMEAGEGVDVVHDMERPLPRELGFFEHVMCASVLEHCRRPWKVAKTIEDRLVISGTLYVSVPTVWRFHPYPDDYWRFMRSSLDVLFPHIGWTKVLYQRDDGLFRNSYRIPRYDDGRYGKVELHAFGFRR